MLKDGGWGGEGESVRGGYGAILAVFAGGWKPFGQWCIKLEPKSCSCPKKSFQNSHFEMCNANIYQTLKNMTQEKKHT